MIAINPSNDKEGRLFYCLRTANENGEKRHPVIVMQELAIKYNFEIIGKVPQSLFDGWDFWIKFETKPNLPPFFYTDIPWKSVNMA